MNLDSALRKAAIEALAEEAADFASKKLMCELHFDDLTYLWGEPTEEVEWSFEALGLDFAISFRHHSCRINIYLRDQDGIRGRWINSLTDLPGPGITA